METIMVLHMSLNQSERIPIIIASCMMVLLLCYLVFGSSLAALSFHSIPKLPVAEVMSESLSFLN